MYRNQKKFRNTQKLVLTESLLFRQVESKEEKKSHLVGRALGRDRKGVKNSKLGRAVKHDEGDDDDDGGVV